MLCFNSYFPYIPTPAVSRDGPAISQNHEPIKAQQRNKAPHFLPNLCCTLLVRHSRVPDFPFFTDFHIYYLHCATGGKNVLQLEISVGLEMSGLLLLLWSVGIICCWIIIFYLFKVVFWWDFLWLCFLREFHVMVLFRSFLGHKTLEHKCSVCFVLRENAYGNLRFGIV